MSSSPCPGVTLRRIPGSGVPVARVHYTADPTMTEARAAELRRKYTSDARWRREMEVEYEALEGERYIPEYVPEMNDCEPFDVSDARRWTIYHACDPHGRTPHGFLWVAFNQEGESVVCGEFWSKERFNPADCVEYIYWIESDSDEKPQAWEWANGKSLRVQMRIMDTHGKAINSEEGWDYFETFRQRRRASKELREFFPSAPEMLAGLHYYPAKKGSLSLENARDALGGLLSPELIAVGQESHLRPRERVFRTCQEYRNELESVRYPEGDVERPGQEKPLTYRKHLIDCRLYIQTAKPGFVLRRPSRNTFQAIYPNIGY